MAGLLEVEGLTTNAMPPMIATAAASRRNVNGSPRNSTPPNAAMTGTLSCTVAAVVDFICGSAVYQIAYPTPDARAPDRHAYTTPAGSSDALFQRQYARNQRDDGGSNEVAGRDLQRVAGFFPAQGIDAPRDPCAQHQQCTDQRRRSQTWQQQAHEPAASQHESNDLKRTQALTRPQAPGDHRGLHGAEQQQGARRCGEVQVRKGKSRRVGE